MSNMQPGITDKKTIVKCQTGQAMVDLCVLKHQTGICVLYFYLEILRVHMCVRQSVCPESSSAPVWQLLCLFLNDQQRLSLTPAAINSDKSACPLYFAVFSLSFSLQFLKLCYLKPKHVISNILKVAGILHHHWTILRGCLWGKIIVGGKNLINKEIKLQLALSTNMLQNRAC